MNDSTKPKGAVCMKGKYYGVYDIKREEECIGVFESTAEICAYFGAIRPNRVSCAIVRKNPLTFGRERYWVTVFEEPTENGVRKLIRRKLGLKMFMKPDGIYVRDRRTEEWRFFASDFETAMERLAG